MALPSLSRKRTVFALDAAALITIAFLFDLLVALCACLILLRFSEEDRVSFVTTWFDSSFRAFERFHGGKYAIGSGEVPAPHVLAEAVPVLQAPN